MDHLNIQDHSVFGFGLGKTSRDAPLLVLTRDYRKAKAFAGPSSSPNAALGELLGA